MMLWIDGRLHEGTRVSFDLSDRGLLLGDGVFDTAMSLGGRVAFEADHVDRLATAAASLGFVIDRERVVAGLRALAAHCPRAAIRTTVTRGGGPRGLVPHATPSPNHWATAVPLRDGFAFSALTLMPAAIRRNETSPTSRLKTLGYLDAVIAAAQVRAGGFDESLFLNMRDRVACAGTGNLFLLEKGRLLTPPLNDGVLPGIVRRIVLSIIAPHLGIETEEVSLPLDRFLEADMVFLTNSLRLIAPVRKIDNKNIPLDQNGISGGITTAFRKMVAESCGVTIDMVDGP